MKLYAPKYYPSFTCIADRCPHSCCIGWEIDVDADTARRYRGLREGYGRTVRESVSETDGVMHFVLGEGERCPHLDDRGLCRIILELGEDHLCEICREHPRFYHDTPNGKEVGLGMACPEACRLILSSADYKTTVAVGTLAGDAAETDFDAIAQRARIYDILSDASVPYARRLQHLEHTWGVSPAQRSDEDWRSFFGELEYLDARHKAWFSHYSHSAVLPRWAEEYGERFLAYLVFRHCSDAIDFEELFASLGFCLLCERLLASVAADRSCGSMEELIPLACAISEELEYSEENTEAIKLAFWSEAE